MVLTAVPGRKAAAPSARGNRAGLRGWAAGTQASCSPCLALPSCHSTERVGFHGKEPTRDEALTKVSRGRCDRREAFYVDVAGTLRSISMPPKHHFRTLSILTAFSQLRVSKLSTNQLEDIYLI